MMMPKFVPVNNSKHKLIKIKKDSTYSHLKGEYLTPLVIQEFSSAVHDYPIVFVKDSETGQFRVVALLGLKPGENHFYGDDGWRASYLPASILGYPFALAADNKVDEQHILFFDEESTRANKKEGDALFDENGKQTDFVNNMGNFLSELIIKEQQTQEFIKALLKHSLLNQQTLEITLEGHNKFNVVGMYVINEEALNSLLNDAFLELKQQGYLPLIYASLLSMSRIANLVKYYDQANRPQ
jgi:hypothetical protein